MLLKLKSLSVKMASGMLLGVLAMAPLAEKMTRCCCRRRWRWASTRPILAYW